MYYAIVTNKGLAYLEEGPPGPLLDALALLREQRLKGATPDDVEAAFVAAATTVRLGADPGAIYHELAHRAMIKVREPAAPGDVPVVVLSDPPIEHYRGRHGGRRPGAGARARRADGQKRVHVSASLDPELHEAVRAAAAARGATYSETVELLLRAALATSSPAPR